MALRLEWNKDKTSPKAQQKIEKSLRVLKSCGVKVRECKGDDEITGLESLVEYIRRDKPGMIPILDTAIGRTACSTALCNACSICPARKAEKLKSNECRQQLGQYLRTRRENKWK